MNFYSINATQNFKQMKYNIRYEASLYLASSRFLQLVDQVQRGNSHERNREADVQRNVKGLFTNVDSFQPKAANYIFM
jgi:hypothetical protein